MYCKKCGNQISDDFEFCPKCGVKQDVTKCNDVALTAQRLKKYKHLKQCTCLECGYNGLMGVTGYKNGIVKRFVIPIIVSAIVAIITQAYRVPWWGSIIIIAIAFLIIDTSLGNNKKILYCPNCEKTLIEK